MAIEIIPKPKIKKTSSLGIFLYVFGLIFLAFLISYFVLDFYQKKSAEELSDVEKTLEKSPSEKNLEDGIFSYQKKIEDIELLVNGHRFTANLFGNLEKNVLPKVWLSKFKSDLTAGTIDILGATDNFEILGQQVLIFEKQEFVKNVNLSKIFIGKDGKVNFDLRLIFNLKIFK